MIKRLFKRIGKRSHNVFVQYALGALYGNFALWGVGAPIVIYKVGRQLVKLSKPKRKPSGVNGGNDAKTV